MNLCLLHALLHSKGPKLFGVLVLLSAIELIQGETNSGQDLFTAKILFTIRQLTDLIDTTYMYCPILLT